MNSLLEVLGASGTLISLLVGVVLKLKADVDKRLNRAYDKIESMQETLEEMTLRALLAEARLEAQKDQKQ